MTDFLPPKLARRGADAEMYRIQVITCLDKLVPLRQQWNSLLAQATDNIPFLTYEWLTTWWQAFADGERMYVITVWRDSELAAIAPMAYTSKRFLGRTRTIITLWSNAYSNRVNFIVRKDSLEAVEAIVTHIFENAPPWDLIDLGPLDQDSALTRRCISTLRCRRGMYGEVESVRSPYLILPQDWNTLDSSLSLSFKKTLQRKTKKANSNGAVVEILTDASRLDDAMAISLSTWQHGNRTSIASTQRLRTFYRGLATAAAENGWLQLALLSVGGQPISFEYNLLYNNALYNLKLGYRADFAKISPGLVLRVHVLKYLIARGVYAYDFLGNAEHYKLHWSKTLRQHVRLWVFARHADLWLIHFVLFRLRPFLKMRFPWLVQIKRKLARRSAE